MRAVTCTATVVGEGTLSIPSAARRQLRLEQGQEVQVTLTRPGPTTSRETQNPLLSLVGIGKGGGETGAENHDQSLYGKRST